MGIFSKKKEEEKKEPENASKTIEENGENDTTIEEAKGNTNDIEVVDPTVVGEDVFEGDSTEEPPTADLPKDNLAINPGDELLDEKENINEENSEKPEPISEMTGKEFKIYKTKKVRVELDKAIQMAIVLFSEENNPTKRSIFMAKAWLGKYLAELGAKNPYSGEEKVENIRQIPPTADVFDDAELIYNYKNENQLQKVLILREHLENVLKIIRNVDSPKMEEFVLNNFYTHVSEARFELGNELSKLRR